MPTPLESMRLVAKELESVGLSFAFVGGCAVWVLVDRPDFTDLRPTEDVDVIIEVVTLGELYELEEQLRATGFQHDISEVRQFAVGSSKGAESILCQLIPEPLG